MAVNKQFSGNVVDSSEQPLPNIRYRGYHTNSGTWSDWYESNSYTQYNINLGDAAWLSQYGSVNVGDTVLLVFETLETDIKIRQFSMIKITILDIDYYINDVQLLNSHAPNMEDNWYLSSTTNGTSKYILPNTNTEVNIGRINDTITATSNPNTKYTWYYNDTKHYQLETYYGQDIFKDRIQINSIEYKWEDTYINLNTHTYLNPSDRTIGYTTVYTKVTNASNDITNDNLKIQIRYRKPILLLTWTPSEPNANDILTIKNETTDIDNRIVNMDYYFDNNIVTSNDNITYQWTENLNGTYVNEHTIRLENEWDNGFFQDTDFVYYRIPMSNIPPTFEVTVEQIDNITYRFTPTNIVDPDGLTTRVNFRWRIEYYMEFDSSYKQIYINQYSNTIDQSPKEWIFTIPGMYKITTFGIDDGGGEYIVTTEVTVVQDDCVGTVGEISLDFDTNKFVAIPIKDGKIYEDFIKAIDTTIKTYDANKSAKDVIEYVTTIVDSEYVTYVPSVTMPSNQDNFKLTLGTNLIEVIGFYIKIKDYSSITSNVVIKHQWNTNGA